MFTADDLEIRYRKVSLLSGNTVVVGQIISPIPRSFDEKSIYEFKLYFCMKGMNYDFVSGFFKDGKYYLNYDIRDEKNFEGFALDIYNGMKMFDWSSPFGE